MNEQPDKSLSGSSIFNMLYEESPDTIHENDNGRKAKQDNPHKGVVMQIGLKAKQVQANL
ncbi:hypothetical protein HN51_055763, partial [Arachis hypogaea]